MDFGSHDRLFATPDGKGFRRVRWSTPVRKHRLFLGGGSFSRGEGGWHSEEGAYTYLEQEVLALEGNDGSPEESLP